MEIEHSSHSSTAYFHHYVVYWYCNGRRIGCWCFRFDWYRIHQYMTIGWTMYCGGIWLFCTRSTTDRCRWQQKSTFDFNTGLLITISFSIFLTIFGISVSISLPRWLGASNDIYKNAFLYFLVYVALPAQQLNVLSSSMLQCSGNMKVPSILNAIMCVLDCYLI